MTGAGSEVVYCLPHAGAGRHTYLALGADLGERWQSLDYRGRYTRDNEPGYSSFDDALDDLTSVVTGHAAGRRIGLFGHSLGGTLAFELARKLVRGGLATVTAVVVSSTPPPEDPALTGPPLHDLEDEWLLDELVELGSDPRQRPLLQAVLPYLRADLELHRAHRPNPDPVLTVPLHAAFGTAEPFADRMSAWQAWSGDTFDLHPFPGGHFHWQGAPGALGALLTAAFGADPSAMSGPGGSQCRS